MRYLREKLEDILVKSGKITSGELSKALKLQKKNHQPLRKILIEKGFMSEQDVMLILSKGLAIPPLALAKLKIPENIISYIPEKIAKQYGIMPVSKIGNSLTVAIADPMNVFAIDEIKDIVDLEIDFVLSKSDDIKRAIEHYYASKAVDYEEIFGSEAQAGAVDHIQDEDEIDIRQITQESLEAPIIKLVNLILIDAIRKKASDIHIEPFRENVRVRFRIDGALHPQTIIPKKYQNAVTARLKIMSNMDITEFRIPEDGRFKVRLDEKDIDFRVSLLPVAFGGKLVLRALDRSSLSLGLDKLGYLPNTLKRMNEAIKSPFGMILVTGPTGSGKSTTLYSVLNELNTPEKNIITVEDPVEYQLEGTTQMQVLQEVGFTFAEGLRSMLRQSPDIIMVGEIRDAETADIAIKSALTGHLVFSTLHTNDAASAITRLRDMGVEPFLVASSVVMVVAQRLCRKNCTACAKPYDIPESVLQKAGYGSLSSSVKAAKKFKKGEGCSKCHQTGYSGRIAIAEAFVMDDELKRMIITGQSADQLKAYAVKEGMLTLRASALRRFEAGETTLEEVLRVTAEE